MRLALFNDFLHAPFRHLAHRSFRHNHSLFLFQQKELWQAEDSAIHFAADRADSDDEDPDLAAYTPRIDLEVVQTARASKDSSSDDDECCIVEPVTAKPLAYALPVAAPAGAAPRTGTQPNAPPATKGKGKKPATKTKKNVPPAMPAQRRTSRVAPVGSG